MPKRSASKPLILTIGHSTRPLDDFLELLRANGVAQLIDIRTIPKSRHNPQFNSDTVAAALHANKIGYVHLKALGGLRHPKKDSINTGWRNASFRGYADYMQTPDFEAALERAIALAQKKSSALMCAEAVPWRCHRSLVADALTARHIPVEHIISPSSRHPHELTSFAAVRGTRITYPAPDSQTTMDFTPDESDRKTQAKGTGKRKGRRGGV